MGRFLYFFPEAQNLEDARRVLEAEGQDEVVASAGRTGGQCAHGPSGGRGLLVGNTVDGVPPRLLYEPDAQTWAECGDDRRYWIGYWTASKPGPADLARPTMLTGWPVELDDGQEWQIPRAIEAPAATCPFPKTAVLKPGNEVATEVVSRYAALEGFAREVFEALTEQAFFSADDRQLMAWAGRAIAANYYAGEWETGAALRLWGTESIRATLFALIDFPTFEAYAEILAGKKNLHSDFFDRYTRFGETLRTTFQPTAS